MQLSPGQYGLLASSFYLLFSAGALVVGLLTTRLSSKAVLLGMGVVWALCQLPLLGVGASLGVVIAAPVLTLIIVTAGWRWAFGVLGIVGLAWALAWLFVGREGPIDTATHYPHSPTRADRTASDGAGGAIPTWRLLCSTTWIGATVAYGAFYWALVVLVAWVPAYLVQVLGYSVSTAGLLDVLPWLLGGISILTYGALSQPMLRRGMSTRFVRGIIGGSVLIVAGAALLAMTRSGGGITPLVLLTIAFGLGGPMSVSAVTVIGEIAPSDRRGLLLGVHTAVTSIAAIAAPAVFGALVQTSPGPAGFRLGFDLTAIVLIIGGGLGVALMRPRAHDARTD